MSEFAADEGEVLEAGYGDTTPGGDNVLLDYVRGEADSFAAIAASVGGRVERNAAIGLLMADTGSATPFGNTAHFTRPIRDDAVPEAAAALHDFFGAASGGPFMVFSPWPIGDLTRHGFHRVGHPPLMLRAPAAPDSEPTGDFRVVPVENQGGLDDFEQTLIEAYPVPEMQPWQRGSFFEMKSLDTNWRFFAGYEGDRCVATAGAWLSDSITIVEFVSAREETRGKGYGTAITAAATHARPGRPAMLIASDLGRPIYDRLGYVPMLRYTLYLGLRSAT